MIDFLLCSVCGADYRGHQNPDFDLGRGECKRCRPFTKRLLWKNHILPRIELVRKNLSPKNKAIFEKMSLQRQEYTVLKLEEKGVFKYSIGGSA
jgi:hypothetical protein